MLENLPSKHSLDFVSVTNAFRVRNEEGGLNARIGTLRIAENKKQLLKPSQYEGIRIFCIFITSSVVGELR